jgi:hypothetical protein
MSVSTIQHPETEFGKLAYQVDGQSDGIPLVLLQRFRGTMDDWDPTEAVTLFIALRS